MHASFSLRVVVALLVVALLTPAAAVCGSAGVGPDPMAGMACCEKPGASDSASVEQNCCRMNEQVPESTPAAPIPPRMGTADTSLAPAGIVVSRLVDETRAHRELQSARGRPLTPVFLRTSALLI